MISENLFTEFENPIHFSEGIIAFKMEPTKLMMSGFVMIMKKARV